MPPQVGEILFRRALSKGGAPSTSLSNKAPLAAKPSDWLDWMRAGLPPALAAHVVQVLLKGAAVSGTERQLVVFADSPAWCARLRYALLALEERIRARDPAIGRLSARVLRLD